MRVVLYNIFTVCLCALLVSCISSKLNEEETEYFITENKILFKHKKEDQSEELQKILGQGIKLTIEFEKNKTYEISDVVVSQADYLHFIGNGAILIVKSKRTANSIFTFFDPKHLIIENLTLSGNYPSSSTRDFLLKIYTPSNQTKNISIDNVSFINADEGGVLVQNVFPRSQPYNYKAGAENVMISNCTVNNVGRGAGYKIRGSHRNVLFNNCFGTDPFSRQHLSKGQMFAVSAEVQNPNDQVGNVVFKNCQVENSNKGFFIQKTKKTLFKNIHVNKMGHRPLYYQNNKKVGLVALKIDDLGLNNQVIIDSFFVTNTAESPYKYFISIEETPKVGKSSNVIINYFEADMGIRLGASGGHRVNGGKLYKGEIRFQSENNIVNNVLFARKSQGVAIEVLASNNMIRNCQFRNSSIQLFKQARQTTIENCQLLETQSDKFIVIDMNDPSNPISLFIDKCTVPKNVLGIWSGGGFARSKNMDIRLNIDDRSFKVHDHIEKNANIKQLKENKW